jgi:hypothetical protein
MNDIGAASAEHPKLLAGRPAAPFPGPTPGRPFARPLARLVPKKIPPPL